MGGNQTQVGRERSTACGVDSMTRRNTLLAAGQSVRTCRWGKFEWDGPWSDGSPEWEEHKRVFGKVNQEHKEDGVFWMSFDDFYARQPDQ